MGFLKRTILFIGVVLKFTHNSHAVDLSNDRFLHLVDRCMNAVQKRTYGYSAVDQQKFMEEAKTIRQAYINRSQGLPVHSDELLVEIREKIDLDYGVEESVTRRYSGAYSSFQRPILPEKLDSETVLQTLLPDYIRPNLIDADGIHARYNPSQQIGLPSEFTHLIVMQEKGLLSKLSILLGMAGKFWLHGFSTKTEPSYAVDAWTVFSRVMFVLHDHLHLYFRIQHFHHQGSLRSLADTVFDYLSRTQLTSYHVDFLFNLFHETDFYFNKSDSLSIMSLQCEFFRDLYGYPLNPELFKHFRVISQAVFVSFYSEKWGERERISREGSYNRQFREGKGYKYFLGHMDSNFRLVLRLFFNNSLIDLLRDYWKISKTCHHDLFMTKTQEVTDDKKAALIEACHHYGDTTLLRWIDRSIDGGGPVHKRRKLN